jgi:hypothetical protein
VLRPRLATVAKLDAVAFGIALGLTSGLLLMVSIAKRFVVAGHLPSAMDVIPHLVLISLTGFVTGWAFALVRNAFVLLWLARRDGGPGIGRGPKQFVEIGKKCF